MILKVFFVLRKELGQCGGIFPEALVVVDQWADDGNPDWFPETCDEQLATLGDELGSHAVVEIEVSEDTILERLGGGKVIKGAIQE